jgi:hypothetical protein
LIFCVFLLVPLCLFAVDTETVSEASFTHIQTYTGYTTDVFSNRGVLEGIGFVCNYSKIAQSTDDINLLDDIAAHGDYGGVLLWESHIHTGYVMCEGFAYSDSGLIKAENRKADLELQFQQGRQG